MTPKQLYQYMVKNEHCSAIVSMPQDKKDVFLAHNTWDDYTRMLRVVKAYTLHFSGVAASSVVFPGYFGTIISGDDVYTTESSRLTIMETTNLILDESLFKLITPNSVLYFYRVLIATRLARTTSEWIQLFGTENSGTYNNQYIVVDYNKFKPGQKARAGFIWAIEQLPGYYNYGDRTDEFNTNRYIPSLNTPFFEDVYEKAKYPEKVIETNSTYWSYWDNSRMHIVERDVPNLKDYEDFKTFMRSNDWEHDPLTNYDPAEAILSRYDLRPDDCIPNGNSLMCPNVFGGTDSKTTNYNNVMNHKFDFISSPQYETQPAWEFGVGKYANYDYTGLPKKWTFPRLSFGYDD